MLVTEEFDVTDKRDAAVNAMHAYERGGDPNRGRPEDC